MNKTFILLIIFMFLISFSLFGADIQVAAVVEKNILSVGESFIYQIQIQGNDNASGYPEETWDDSDFTDSFNVAFLGGQNNSSRQISIINGRRKEIINSSYIISYSLTPLKTGNLVIPAVSLNIDGNQYTTRTIKIESREAMENDDLKLVVSLDKKELYVGEPLLITFTWYIGVNIKDFLFTVPFFEDRNFSFLESTDFDPDPASLVRFPINGVSVTAVQGKGVLKGKTYTTVTFSKLVIPKTSGNYSIPKSVISVSAEISNGRRGNDLFNSFFSSFSTEYGQFSVPSNNLSLKVLALPANGRPANFNGYIGELNIETSASPVEVRVGDPITFTMKISGPKNIADWDSPDLNEQYELAANFKMPSRISAGKIEGDSIVFTQIIRSLNDTVTYIPALEIPYFDTEKGIYSVARSEAIPINVVKGSAVKLEGETDQHSNETKQEVVSAGINGMNFNYDDIKILNNQSFGLTILTKFPFNILIVLPPLIFFGVLFFKLSQNKNYFRKGSKRKITLTEFRKKLKKIELGLETSSSEVGSKLQTLFKSFIADKIQKTESGVSEKDFTAWLINKKLEAENFSLIFEIFHIFDEIQYSGSFLPDTEYKQQLTNLIHKVLLAIEDLDGRNIK